MPSQRLMVASIAVVVMVLLGMGAFVFHDRNASVEQVRVYELPDSNLLTENSPRATSLTASVRRVVSYADETSQSTGTSALPDDRSELQKQRRIEALEASAARDQLILEELEAYKAVAEAEKQKRKALLAEAQDAAEWIADWVQRTEPLYAEVAFILFDPSIVDQEDFKRAFPDLDERAYYAERLVEAEKASDEFAARLARLSEPLRSGVLDGIRAKWTPTAGKEMVDAFIEQVNDKLHLLPR